MAFELHIDFEERTVKVEATAEKEEQKKKEIVGEVEEQKVENKEITKKKEVKNTEIEDKQEKSSIKIQLREDVFLSWGKGVFRLNMGKSGRGRKERVAKVEQLRNLTIFSDTSAIEVFINDGETVMTTRVYNETLEQTVTFLSKGNDGNVGNVTGYELGSFVIEK